MQQDRTCRLNLNAQREITRIVNRHKSRILHNLEKGGCPRNFREDIRDGVDWLRSDLSRLNGIVIKKKDG